MQYFPSKHGGKLPRGYYLTRVLIRMPLILGRELDYTTPLSTDTKRAEPLLGQVVKIAHL